ncbi:uncharacterized protein ARMOST_15809 [Armillaria ostoyae]|uniref:DUF6535 domain-containing protein n=1 Tax=Armillaria ostoyae TaxID=47428 RepID=A0A284RUG5_ARMOS|nr:uncharacterized protein ARMOST_15809 [Armillaria ostoyae]
MDTPTNSNSPHPRLGLSGPSNSDAADFSASNATSTSAVPNVAYYSRPRRRKFNRRRMGLKAQSQTRGHDPSDYEQKYSEDARGEEMGLFARIWRIYLDECAIFDAEMVEDWRDGLDVLLIFAGLFSAVVSTFVVQTSQNLQIDYGEVSASLLFELVNVQRAMANGASVDLVPRSSLTPYTSFHPKTLDSWVNGLWFASLSISLSTALVAALAKQWIHQYVSVPSGTPRDRMRVRHVRYMNLQDWHLPAIIGLLPVLMHTALGLFLLGLAIFLIPQSVEIGGVTTAIILVGFFAYLSANLLPLAYPHCPFRTPLSGFIYFVFDQVSSAYHHVTLYIFSTYFSRVDSARPRIREKSLKDVERMAVYEMGVFPDVQAIAWLHSISSNPIVQSIAVQSTSCLPLKSTDLIKQKESMLESLRQGIEDCIDIRTGVRSGMGGDLERCLRACLHLQLPVHSGVLNPLINVVMGGLAKENIPSSRTTFLAALRYQGGDDANVIADLLESKSESELAEQPVIWANILCNILTQGGPFHGEIAVNLYKALLNAFPTTYWSFNWVEPAIGFRASAMYPEPGCPDIEICDAECDVQANLTSAISSCLYPLLGKLLVYHFSRSAETDTGGEDSSPCWSGVPIPLQVLLSMLRSQHIEDAGLLHDVLVHLQLYVTTLTEQEAQVWNPDKRHTCRTIIRHLYTITRYAIEASSHTVAWSQMDNQQLLWDIFVDALSTSPSLGDPDFVEETSRWWASADKILLGNLPRQYPSTFADMHLFENMIPRSLNHLNVSGMVFLRRILQLATDELFRPINLLIIFQVLVKTRDIQRMKGIGRLRPNAPAWEVLFTTFDKRTSDVAFWERFVDSDRDPATYNAILLEFRQNWKAERRILN